MLMQTVNSNAERTSGMPYMYEDWEADYAANIMFEEHMNLLAQMEWEAAYAADEMLAQDEAWATEEEQREVMPTV